MARIDVVTFDAADLEAESAFWAGVLGGEVDRDDGWHMVNVDGAPRVGVQHAPGHVPPDWPNGSPPQQMHLDLWVEDFPAAHEQVIALGARVLQSASGATLGDDFQVYADPAGTPFCPCFMAGDAPLPDRFTATWRTARPEENLEDLVRHAKDYEERRGFTYSILEGDGVIGCIYIYPDRRPGYDAVVSSWVRESRPIARTSAN